MKDDVERFCRRLERRADGTDSQISDLLTCGDVRAATRVIRAAVLRRNAVIVDNEDFEGKWVAIPWEDFTALRDALKNLPHAEDEPDDLDDHWEANRDGRDTEEGVTVDDPEWRDRNEPPWDPW